MTLPLVDLHSPAKLEYRVRVGTGVDVPAEKVQLVDGPIRFLTRGRGKLARRLIVYLKRGEKVI